MATNRVALSPGPIVERIIAILTADLPAKFDVIDTQIAESFTLDDVAYYYRALLERFDAFPCVVLYPVLDTPFNQEAGWYARQYELELQIMMVSREAVDGLLAPEVMEKRLEYSIRGIEEVLNDNRILAVTGFSNVAIIEIAPVEYLDFEFANTAFGRRAMLRLVVDAK